MPITHAAACCCDEDQYWLVPCEDHTQPTPGADCRKVWVGTVSEWNQILGEDPVVSDLEGVWQFTETSEEGEAICFYCGKFEASYSGPLTPKNVTEADGLFEKMDGCDDAACFLPLFFFEPCVQEAVEEDEEEVLPNVCPSYPMVATGPEWDALLGLDPGTVTLLNADIYKQVYLFHRVDGEVCCKNKPNEAPCFDFCGSLKNKPTPPNEGDPPQPTLF
jgi:hypothetical protein